MRLKFSIRKNIEAWCADKHCLYSSLDIDYGNWIGATKISLGFFHGKYFIRPSFYFHKCKFSYETCCGVKHVSS